MIRSLVSTGLLVFLAAIFMSSTSHADLVIFDFVDIPADNDATASIDGGTTGDTFIASGASETVTFTIIDVFAPEYVDDGAGNFALASPPNTLAAADGNQTNINGNADALGVNNASIGNNDFEASISVTGTEGNDFNPGESVVFTLDRDVTFDSIELESVTATDEFEVLVNGVSLYSVTGPTDGNESSLGVLSTTTILAGDQITFAVDGPIETTSLRIESFTVHAKPLVSIPEPSSMALVGMIGLGFAARRRR